MQLRKSFQYTKRATNRGTVLQQPDFEKKFIKETNVFNVGIGAVLCQEFDGDSLPVAFASRKLGSAERNYSISEKKMLAELCAMEHFKYFLLEREFKLITDHKALKALDDRGTLRSKRIEHWIERIQLFSLKVECRQGRKITHVDGLSRITQTHHINIIKDTIEKEKKKAILNFYKQIVHRGARIICEKYNKAHKDQVSYQLIKEVLSNCVECKLYNLIKVNNSH